MGGGNVVNEVVFEYNDLGMLAKEHQEHEGAKDASTLYVQYNYDETASGASSPRGCGRRRCAIPAGGWCTSRMAHPAAMGTT